MTRSDLRRISCSSIAFALLGALAKIADLDTVTPLGSVFGNVGLFVAALLVAGAVSRSVFIAALSVVVGTLVMIGAYYVTGEVVDSSGYTSLLLTWVGIGLVVGPVFAWAGYTLWSREGVGHRAARIAWGLTVGVLLGEACYLSLGYLSSAAVLGAAVDLGLALVVGIARRSAVSWSAVAVAAAVIALAVFGGLSPWPTRILREITFMLT